MTRRAMLVLLPLGAFVGVLVTMAVDNPPGYPWILAAPVGLSWAASWWVGSRLGRAMSAPRPRGSFAGHDHGLTPGPCPACLASVIMLGGLVGAVVEDAERLATTGEIWEVTHLARVTRWIEEMDADVTAYMAAYGQQAAAFRFALGAPLETVPPCRAMLGRHLCRVRDRGAHLHRCSCGESWGIVP